MRRWTEEDKGVILEVIEFCASGREASLGAPRKMLGFLCRMRRDRFGGAVVHAAGAVPQRAKQCARAESNAIGSEILRSVK